MAVNGIEIKVGQKWKQRNGFTVTVEEYDGGYTEYPWRLSNDTWITRDGAEWVRECSRYDLVELIEDVPAVILEVKETTAPDILTAAAAHMAARAATYDKPEGERSMGKTVQAFNAITGHTLTESEGWLLLQVLKDVRLFQRAGFHQDSAEDCVAYAALKAEAKSKEVV